MKSEEEANLVEALAALREQLATLTERVAALEAGGRPAQPEATVAQAPADEATSDTPAPAVPVELNEETLLVISAAIAAFLGKKPRIRQVRLVSSSTWAQQGRAGIHASHAFAVHSRSGAAS